MPRTTATLALLALYVGLEWLSFLHEHNDLPVTPWNPGLGLMFAMIILRGPGMGLVLFAGVFLAQVLVVRSDLAWFVLLAMSAAIALSYTTVAAVAGRKLRLGPQLSGTRDVLALVATGLAGALAEAVQLSLLLLAAKQFQLGDIASTSVPLIVGDVIGIAVVTPLVLRLAVWTEHPTRLARAMRIELAMLVVVIALVLMLVVRPPVQLGPSLFYLLFVPVVVAAVRYGIDGACTALAIAQLGLVSFLHWHGFELSRFTEFQILMLVLTVTGLLVGGLVGEREAEHAAAEAARRRLRALEEQAAGSARLNIVSGMAAALAHELNQPMTAARALARSVQELMREPVQDTARIRSNLTAMVEQIDHAGSVIRRMREFLRRGEPHMSTLDIGRVLADSAALLAPLVEPRGLPLRLDVPVGLPMLIGDRVQLGQVIVNLMRNSVEAIPEEAEGRIDVSARSVDDGRAIEIAIRDNGRGIPPDQIAALFEPLNTSRADGIGLGLSICQTIVHAHGGRIWLGSSGLTGTEFRIRLPAKSSS